MRCPLQHERVAASAWMCPEHLLPGLYAANQWELSVYSFLLTLPKQLRTTMVSLKDDAILKVKFKEDSSADRLF